MCVCVRERERETHTFFLSDGYHISAPDVRILHVVDIVFGENAGKARLDVLTVLLVVGTPGHIVSQDGNILETKRP